MKLVIFSSAETATEPRLFFKVARSAAAVGYEVNLIAQHPVQEVCDGVQITPVATPSGRMQRMFLTVWSVFAKALRARGDVYHFSDPELIPLGLLLQWMTRRPVILDLREYHSERIRHKYWLPRPLRGPIARTYEWVEAMLVRRFAGVAVVNEDLRQRLARRGCRQIAVVPNYPPRSVFADQRPNEAFRKRHEGRRVVIYVGGMSMDRGILQAIRAMADVRGSVSNAKLVLVGRFHPAFEERARLLVREMGLSDVVEIAGIIPHTDVPGYLAASNVGLCLLQPTSKRYEETEPIKYFEYAAAGLPQVVSDLPALRRLIETNGNGLLVEPTNETVIAQAIISLLRDEGLAAEQGMNGRRAFLGEYNWDTSFRRLQDLYERTVAA